MSRPFAVAPRLATWRYACHDAASTMAGLSLLGAGLSLLGAIAAVSRQGVRQWRQANWGKLGQIGEGLELKISWSARVCSACRQLVPIVCLGPILFVWVSEARIRRRKPGSWTGLARLQPTLFVRNHNLMRTIRVSEGRRHPRPHE